MPKDKKPKDDVEWIGGKQVYSRQDDNNNDDWLSEFSEEDFGFGFGCRPTNRTVENKETENDD